MGKIIKILKMIKFEHSVFALPFALMSAFLTEKKLPSIEKLILIIIAMVAARSAAMAFNRFTDLPFDKLNPRTSNWILPQNELSITFVKAFTMISIAIFIMSTYMLNKICFMLSPIALFIILSYSYSKRFTYLTHFHLGLSLSIAPIGAWLAIIEKCNLTPILIAISVILWVAGFDILYATQDIEFDKKYNLKSIPARYGIKNALILSSLCHAIMMLPLILIYFIANMGIFYLAGLLISAIFLTYQHCIISTDNLSRLNQAFFTFNGLLSISIFLFTTLDIYYTKNILYITK